jgi:alkylation response protein AidB-like acyl-CoA dehydrogenase
MDFDLGPDAASLRQRLRDLIAEHLPSRFLGACTDDPSDLETTRRFAQLLADEKLLALAWPREHGGQDATVWEQTVLREEMWAHHEPRGPQYMGVNWVGPAISRFGTPGQQRLHLPPIAAGQTIWCQGFSEPDAGSDLASLRTMAAPAADGWRVNGQKIWTSYAQMAQWCFLAARTGPAGSRRDGVSIFLVPMDRDGVTVRPIDSMLGPHHLNEVFFDDVQVGPDEILAAENQGWNVIRATLAFERVGIARYARADRLLNALLARLGGLGELPSGLRARYTRAMVHNRVARLLAYEVVARQADDQVDASDAALARIAAVLGDQEVSDVLVEAVTSGFFDSGDEADETLHAAIEDYWRYSRAATVAAGSIDIQRTVAARAAFGADQ